MSPVITPTTDIPTARPRYSRYSPGVLLQLFNMQNLSEYCSRTQWIDSCVVTQHPLMNRWWT